MQEIDNYPAVIAVVLEKHPYIAPFAVVIAVVLTLIFLLWQLDRLGFLKPPKVSDKEGHDIYDLKGNIGIINSKLDSILKSIDHQDEINDKLIGHMGACDAKHEATSRRIDRLEK